MFLLLMSRVLLTLLMGNVTLIVYDLLLTRFALLYAVRLRGKLFH